MLQKLLELAQSGDDEGIIKLELDPESQGLVDVIKTKVVALIRLDRYEEALKMIIHSKAGLELGFEEAYCLYRINKLHESLKVLEECLKHPDLAAEVKENLILLKAQVVRTWLFTKVLSFGAVR